MVLQTMADGVDAEVGGRSKRRRLSARFSSLSPQDQGALIDGSSAALSEGQLPANDAFLASLALLESPAEPSQPRQSQNERAEPKSLDRGSDQNYADADVTSEQISTTIASLPGTRSSTFLSVDTNAAEELAALSSRQ